MIILTTNQKRMINVSSSHSRNQALYDHVFIINQPTVESFGSNGSPIGHRDPSAAEHLSKALSNSAKAKVAAPRGHDLPVAQEAPLKSAMKFGGFLGLPLVIIHL